MPVSSRKRDKEKGTFRARPKRGRGNATPLGKRIRTLIRQFYGSQRLAARAWGTTRATIDRILTGEVEEPRGDLLVRIARACGTSTDWLLMGEGSPPKLPHDPLPSQVQEQWQEMVEGLGVDDATRDALLLLPGRVRRAFAQLLVWDPITRHDETPFTARQLTARRQAEDRETQAWIDLLKLVLDRYGAAETRRVLQHNRTLLGIGFNSATRLFLEYLTLHDKLDNAALMRGFDQAVKQCAMTIHPRVITQEEVQAAIDPFAPPSGDAERELTPS